MSEEAVKEDEGVAALRALILDDPELILGDRSIMQALINADGAEADGRNVVDLRGRLVHRLEDRLENLAETHRTVVAAAYENLAGTNQVHRAVLALLEAEDFVEFLKVLGEDAPAMLTIDMVRIALETPAAEAGKPLGPKGPLAGLITGLPPGGVDVFMGAREEAEPRKIILRASTEAAELLFGEDGKGLRSEAVMRLDLGKGKRPGVLVLGAEDPYKFHPEQATDLLGFFASAFESMLRRWLA
ncbi:DUF484 family protein [Halovulum sp. GXIMD14793]